MTKVLIEIRGGIITEITANTKDIEISVMDYDIAESDGEAPKYQYYKSTADKTISDKEFNKYLLRL